MKLEITACETCGMRTDDFYAETNWMRIGTGMSSVSWFVIVSKGRIRSGIARTLHKSLKGDLEFCSKKCFFVFIDQAMRQTRKK